MNSKLENKIDSLKKMSIEELCEKFNCKPEEICMGDYYACNTSDTVCPYKVILGFANFEGSNVTSLGNLEVVYGKKLADAFGVIYSMNHQPIYLSLNLKKSKITSLGKLRKIYGSVNLNENITTMKDVEFLGTNLYVFNSNLQDLGNIEIIDGILNLEDDDKKCKITSLGKLKKVRTIYLDTNSLKDLGELEEFREIRFGIRCNFRIRKLFEDNFKKVGTRYLRKDLIQNQDEIDDEDQTQGQTQD